MLRVKLYAVDLIEIFLYNESGLMNRDFFHKKDRAYSKETQ